MLASRAREVIGVELSRDAVADARANAAAGGIKNAVFEVGDAGEFMQTMANERRHADVVMLDPPRAGCSHKFLQSLLTLAPSRIVYISCNPETQARDLATLVRGGYEVKKIQPVDMFPFTSHVECVVCLTRSAKDKADERHIKKQSHHR